MANLVTNFGGDGTGMVHHLKQSPVAIGSAGDAHLNIGWDSSSLPRHAEVFLNEGAWFLRDLGAGNTLLNGNPVTSSRLADGDVFSIGQAAFRFDDHAATPPRERAAGTAAATQGAALETLVPAMADRTKVILGEISKGIVGQREIILDVLTAIISRGHVLLIGMPGLAKTTLVRTIADVLDMKFNRIQFTPDLMPSDITGTDILEVDEETGKKEYRFIKGPIFTQILLADEINRTPPKTQAALLEAMQEFRVTVGGESMDLGKPFFVLATQNPLEQEGTYPLPEAQLDRFMFSVYVDYPTEDEEELIAKLTTVRTKQMINKVMGAAEVLELQECVRDLPVSDHVIKYAVRLVRSTRPADSRSPDFIKKYIHCGAGPRAVQNLVLAAKARAVIDGRLLVTGNDIRSVARPVLRHRMFTNFTADSEGMDTDKIVQRLVKEVEEPSEKDYR
ncbi:MAG: FHA domain-containing protein [Verrucomicrobiaceae bacterium]|nr:MAG: FHA domain-containing protein [Verrucomicrobiaceae bacterium]